jgi:hypothetical protein
VTDRVTNIRAELDYTSLKWCKVVQGALEGCEGIGGGRSSSSASGNAGPPWTAFGLLPK